MDDPCDGNVLLVGDGDFSFSVSLFKTFDHTSHQVFATSLESHESIKVHVQALENSQMLQEMGVQVLMEVDARELHNHSVLSTVCFGRVIFNFPLEDRHNIKKNRSLLADFFSSCKHILTKNGQVMVTLCKGQGGTPADKPMRSWQDSWQVVAMASKSGFVLTDVRPFSASEFPEYHSVGFRFQDKSFNTAGALTHIFEQAEMAEDRERTLRDVLTYSQSSFSCSSSVAQKMKRNLLNEVNNPVAILKGQMENCFEPHTKVIDTLPVCQGHKSKVTLSLPSKESSGNGSKDEKDRKNLEIVQRQEVDTKLLLHTVERQCGDEGEGKNRRAGQGGYRATASSSDYELKLMQYASQNSEAVYCLIKTLHDKVRTKGSGNIRLASEKACRDGHTTPDSIMTVDEDVENVEHEMLFSSAAGFDSAVSCQESSANADEIESAGVGGVNAETNRCDDPSARVFHCRTSLLEQVPQLIEALIADSKLMSKREGDYNERCCDGDRQHVVSEYGLSQTADDDGMEIEGDKDHNFSLSSLSAPSASSNSHSVMPASCQFSPWYIASGQCMQLGLITPGSLNIKHEFLLLNDLRKHSLSDPGCSDISQHQMDALAKESSTVSETALTLIQKSAYFPETSDFSLCPVVNRFEIDIEQTDHVLLVNHILLTTKHSDTSEQGNAEVCDATTAVGITLLIQKGKNFFHLCLFNLDDMVCQLYGIPDSRILWSNNEKFLRQFSCTQTTPNFFKHLSLYPLQYTHDLSFWERENDDVSFDVLALCDIVRSIAGDLVVNLTLIDSYSDPGTGRQSRCYRLHFLSHDKALSYLTSWKLQSRIRLQVAQTLGVELR